MYAFPVELSVPTSELALPDIAGEYFVRWSPFSNQAYFTLSKAVPNLEKCCKYRDRYGSTFISMNNHTTVYQQSWKEHRFTPIMTQELHIVTAPCGE